jgi:murein DD-endopeptidase MepM/ murein hydrolase activator NlpD
VARRSRRLLMLGALALLLAAPAAADDVGQRKVSVDARLAAVQQQLTRSREHESVLSRQISSLTHDIQALESQVGNLSAQLSALERDLALHRARLAKLDQLLQLQARRSRELRRQYRLSVSRLDARLVAIYKEPNPSTLDVLVAARSFQDVLDQMDYLGAIAAQDKRVAQAVASAKRRVALARKRTHAAKRTVFEETRVIGGRAQQVAILRAQLLASRDRLASTRSISSSALAATRRAVSAEVSESKALQSSSDQLAAQLRAAAQAARSTRAASPTGSHPGAPHFIWPVSGPITSPFGMRWGTLHPGIDIGVPSGTPVRAAAAGTVVWCGFMSGYGNLVMIDHGGGYATAYGHNTSVAVSCGQEVAQGQVVAFSGCTGFCTGPHVHFEVRVNGTPVDPLGYLG